jgi:UDP-N-acetylmuramoylalanine--D-glutamate ligase
MRDLSWLPTADRASPWSSLRVVVAGAGRSGEAAARVLVTLGAEVVVVDDGASGRQQEAARRLDDLGATVVLAAGPQSLRDVDLVVASPGLTPRAPLLVRAQTDGVPVWSGERLAWHLRPAGSAWLALTGTNGKTTTVMMLESMLLASGERAVAAGNIGRPLVEAVMAEPGYSVLAVELSSFQLHFTADLEAQAAALLNLGVDHVDWHGSYDAYVDDKARIFTGARRAVVYNAGDAESQRLARDADVADGCRRVGFTADAPSVGMVGVVDEVVVDRAFGVDPQREPVELAALSDIDLPGTHNLLNALAAAALARAHGVGPAAVRDGLRGFHPAPHRAQWVADRRGVSYVDDSKATNVDAALVSLRAHQSVVWVAGGLAKGATFDDLVRRTSDRLRGAVLVGQDRELVRDALRRHAPEVPVIEVVGGETDLMDDVVSAAASLAVPGDTVLLAPGCASMDLFVDYAARGDAFAASVRRLPEGER